MKKQEWLIGPIIFSALLIALIITWSIVEPATLVHVFDQGGYSPFELATLPFFAAIVPLVWWKCPFGGSPTRRRLLCFAVSLVAIMAIAKETDLHIAALRFVYPDMITESGSMASGLFKPNGSPLCGTPFKMRVLSNAGVPLGMKALIVLYFASFFGVFAAGGLYFLPKWIRGVFRLEAPSWAFGCVGLSGILVQISDRLPAWLNHAHGLSKRAAEISSSASLCTCLEEGGEMILAIMALVTIVLGHIMIRRQSIRL